MEIMKIYNAMPAVVQNMAVSLEGMRIQRCRYGDSFHKQYQLAMERVRWTYEEKCSYRDIQLQKMIKHCYLTVPYYHRVFDELKLDYREIKTIEDLKVLPVIDKAIVRENMDDFISSEFQKKELICLHTSGSSGSGLSIYQDKHANAAVWAHVWRWYHNIGLQRNLWCGYFGGRSIVPKNKDQRPHYRINYAGRQIMFSVFHLKPDVYEEYIAVLEKYRPVWLQAYPSALTPLAQYMLEKGIRLSYMPIAITLSSENVSLHQVETIKTAFGIYPLQNYAQTEGVASIYQGLDRRLLVDEDFSAVEFIPSGDGVSSRIVGTSLSNYAMPLLRYDTRDLAQWRLTKAGREILSLDGREEDDIHLRDGGIIRRLSRVFQKQENVAEAQIVQKSYDLLEIRIVPCKGYSQQDEECLRRCLTEYLAGRIMYSLVYKESLVRMANGKTKFIVSEL